MAARKSIDQRMAELEAEKQTLMLRDQISSKLVAIRKGLKKRNVDQLTALAAHLAKVKTDDMDAAPATEAASAQ